LFRFAYFYSKAKELFIQGAADGGVKIAKENTDNESVKKVFLVLVFVLLALPMFAQEESNKHAAIQLCYGIMSDYNHMKEDIDNIGRLDNLDIKPSEKTDVKEYKEFVYDEMTLQDVAIDMYDDYMKSYKNPNTSQDDTRKKYLKFMSIYRCWKLISSILDMKRETIKYILNRR